MILLGLLSAILGISAPERRLFSISHSSWLVPCLNLKYSDSISVALGGTSSNGILSLSDNTFFGPSLSIIMSSVTDDAGARPCHNEAITTVPSPTWGAI